MSTSTAPKRKTRIDTYLEAEPALQQQYDKIRKHAPKIVISGYDITKKCNLRCEGCFFFEGEFSAVYDDDHTLTEYREFFSQEKERGITFPHFAGAEPALVQDRLRVAAETWSQGLIYTNGTKAIDADLPFMLHVSVWGDAKIDKELRGAAVFEKGMRIMQGDERAIFMYTLNHQNLAAAKTVVKQVVDNGLRISFNHYSPSMQYNAKVDGDATNDKGTFRLSSSEDNLRLTDDDLPRIHDMVGGFLEDHPENVVYSGEYNDFINDPVPWKINPETDRASNCVILNKPYHRQYHTDFSYSDDECCIANIDCHSCRHYVAGYTHIMDDFRGHLATQQSFKRWLDVYYTWCRLHFVGWDQLN